MFIATSLHSLHTRASHRTRVKERERKTIDTRQAHMRHAMAYTLHLLGSTHEPHVSTSGNFTCQNRSSTTTPSPRPHSAFQCTMNGRRAYEQVAATAELWRERGRENRRELFFFFSYSFRRTALVQQYDSPIDVFSSICAMSSRWSVDRAERASYIFLLLLLVHM